MFKNILFITVIILVAFAFISCTELPESTIPAVPIGEKLAQAEEALNEGNDSVAENLLNQVLRVEPTNTKANMGMGFINLLKANRKILTLVEDLTDNSSPTVSLRASSPFEFLLEFDFSQFQTDINAIITNLEDSKSELETALAHLTPDSTITIYPNRFDWNKDGYTDSITPLNLSFAPLRNGETRLWWILFDRGPLSAERSIFDETKRGDAWFDIETIDYIVNGSGLPFDYEPTFDENDFVTLNATGIKTLLTFVNLELSILEPALIWDLNPETELTDWITEASNTHDQYDSLFDYATTTIDLDRNGTMTNDEIRTIMPASFLSFYNIPNGGYNAIRDWASALRGLSQTGLELYDAGLLDFLPFDAEDFLVNCNRAITDSRFKIQIGGSAPISSPRIAPLNPTNTFLIPYYFFNHPERFEDLKCFLPIIGYRNFIINFPDETFGGIIEKIPSVREIIRRFIG